MKDNELLFDRKSHVLYSKPCKKEIQAKIALHYPKAEWETIWEQVQRQLFHLSAYFIMKALTTTSTTMKSDPYVRNFIQA